MESIGHIACTRVRAARDLTDMPNISFVLAENLIRVGIPSPEELRRIGAKTAWLRFVHAGLPHDTHRLLALEGAIQGMDWRALSSIYRTELVRFANR